MTIQGPPHNHSPSRGHAPRLLGATVAGLLGVLAAVLVACGSSGAGLIPAGNAGPLQSDFEAIAAAAQSGNGSCASTEAAILKTERDFHALPGNVNNGLRTTLQQGIANLRARALVACTQPLAGTTATSSTKTTQTTPSTSTTTTTTQTTPTNTTPTTTTQTPTTTGPEGGTPAPTGEPAPGGTEPGAGGGAGSGGGQGGGK
jgi:hypothetical protein